MPIPKFYVSELQLPKSTSAMLCLQGKKAIREKERQERDREREARKVKRKSGQ
jgi:hypothetical protein